MRPFARDQQPVLWPEHVDVGITLAEVNYGVSPRRRPRARALSYVGPWAQREGAFWNQDFGAMRLLREIPDVDSLVAFFHEGATRAAAEPESAT
jgi:hypothetical protein